MTSSPSDHHGGAPGSHDDPPAEVDLGSWAGFTPSLGRWLTDLGRSGQDRSRPATAVVLTAPAPVLPQGPVEAPGGLRGLLRRGRRRVASAQAPRAVLTVRPDGVEVSLPLLDASGQALLGDGAAQACTVLGWVRRADAVSRLLPSGVAAAEAVTRVLIEVLRVPHPADLAWRVGEAS